MQTHSDERGRRAPTPAALSSLGPVPDGFRILPDPLHGQPLLRVPARPADVRLLLSRSRESAQAGEPTQDYLALRYEPRRLSFTVTDGVGSSFLGDVAAQILAAHLTDWLALVRPDAHFAERLTSFLRALTQEVAEQVASWPLPSSVSELVRSALEQQRAYGSEAMFACAAIDLTGGRDATVTVAWLGDTRIRVISRGGHRFDHSGQTTDRWSTRLGLRGEVASRSWPVAEVARVIACTDGVVGELDATVELGDGPLSLRLDEVAGRPRNDDMALVDVGLVPRAMPADETGSGPALWRKLTEEPQRRHARPTAGSALRRFMRAVTPAAESASLRAGSEAELAGEDSEPAEPGQPPPAEPVADMSTVEETPPPGPAPPSYVRHRRTELGLEIVWRPVEGADSYAAQVCREPTFADPMLYAVNGLSFAVPPIPAPVYARLRSVAAGEAGPWGIVLDLSGLVLEAP